MRGRLAGPEISATDSLISGDRVGGTVECDPARHEHVGAIGDRERAMHVLLDDDDRDPRCGDSPADGSSKMSRAGDTMRARVMASSCRSPPESVAAR